MEENTIFKDPGHHALDWRKGNIDGEWLAKSVTGYTVQLLRFIQNGRVLFHLNYSGPTEAFSPNDFDFYGTGSTMGIAKDKETAELDLLKIASSYFYALVGFAALDPLSNTDRTIYDQTQGSYLL